MPDPPPRSVRGLSTRIFPSAHDFRSTAAPIHPNRPRLDIPVTKIVVEAFRSYAWCSGTCKAGFTVVERRRFGSDVLGLAGQAGLGNEFAMKALVTP